MKTSSYLGVRCNVASPKQGYRPAVWECMLGTVYAMNDSGVVRYFDYKHDEALVFAGIVPGRELRLAKCRKGYRYGSSDDGPSAGRLVLWIAPTEQQEHLKAAVKVCQGLRLYVRGWEYSRAQVAKLRKQAEAMALKPAGWLPEGFEEALKEFLAAVASN